MARLPLWLVGCVALLPPALPAETPPAPAVSAALRAANPALLSGGLFSALDAAGAFGPRPPVQALRAGMTDRSKGTVRAVLDPRVGANVRMGDDDSALPLSLLGQAEPHLYRSATNPALLLATFQEGRYPDAGALDCGYGISRDGGLTWTRALIPNLTVASGGRFNRATDPVAAIGLNGELYLNTLASVTGTFSTAAVVVSRSTDGGATWQAPAVVFESTNQQTAPDKNWMAVNDYPAAPAAGRVAVTWTNFTSTATGTLTGNNLMASVSDDRGLTWSTPVAFTPAGSINQGTQPVYLPDGSLVVVYVTFANPTTTSQFMIECKRSPDGGRTFPAASTVAVGSVLAWDDPDLRDGVYLPSVTVARDTGDLFVTFPGVIAGSPRILVSKSTNKGATWSTPVVASDNPAGASVVTPAIASSADGQRVAVVFMDKRNAPDQHNFIDLYTAQSFDGGATWQPNVRLTDLTTDIRYGPLTSRGYMFGDYLAVAPAPDASEPCVAIWCDARTGDSDPFTVRFLSTPGPAGFAAWAVARGIDPDSPWDDPDGDGEPNYFEYLAGTDPRDAASTTTLFVSRNGATSLDLAWAERVGGARLSFSDGVSMATLAAYSAGGFSASPTLPAALAPAELPAVALAPGLEWRGVRVPVTAGQAYVAARSAQPGNGLPVATSHVINTVATDARLIDVSTRGAVGTGPGGMIVGFVIDGSKTMLVRAAGPALTPFGVTDVIAAPVLTLNRQADAAVLATNSAWEQSTATGALFVRVGAFAFASGSTDAALVQTLPGGNYTGVVTGANGTTGTALVEAYDADASPGTPSGRRILNLSTRANVVGRGSSTLIAGFVLSGTQPRPILLRAAGPSLAPFGLSGTLNDPQLTLYRGTTGPIASNDDWERSGNSGAIAATAQRVGAFPLDRGSLDASLLITLPPGNYTAVVSGVNDGTGITLVEVYDAD